jgi:hypothetical protein
MDLLDLLSPIVSLLSVLTIIGQAVILMLVSILLREIIAKRVPGRVTSFVARHGLVLMFIVALTATSPFP